MEAQCHYEEDAQSCCADPAHTCADPAHTVDSPAAGLFADEAELSAHRDVSRSAPSAEDVADFRPCPSALLRRCLGGRSEEDWRLLVEAYASPLRGLLIRLSKGHWRRPSEDELEDLLQDLYLRLLRRRGPAFVGQEKDRFWAYLETTARNMLIDRWREERAAKRGCSLERAGLMNDWEIEQRFRPGEARRVAHHLSDRGPSPEQELIRRRGLRAFLRCCAASQQRSARRRRVSTLTTRLRASERLEVGGKGASAPELSGRGASGKAAPRRPALASSMTLAGEDGGARIEITGLYLVYVEGRTSPEVSRALGGALGPRQVDFLVARFRRFMHRRGIVLPGRRHSRPGRAPQGKLRRRRMG